MDASRRVGSKLKNANFRVPAADWLTLKAHAARKRMTMQELLQRMIRAELDRIRAGNATDDQSGLV